MHTKKLLFVLLFFLSTNFIFSQVPGIYQFFGGDTLNGFDLRAAVTAAHQKNVAECDMKGHLKREEINFVRQKYHIPVPTQSAERLFPGNNILAAPCNNVGFEAASFANWTGLTGENDNSTAPLAFTTPGFINSGNNSAITSCSYMTLVNTGVDPFGGFPMLFPGGGSWSCRLGGQNANYTNLCNIPPGPGSPGESISQIFTVTAANAMLSYSYAVVMEQSPHTNTECPYFSASVTDSAGNPLTCLQYYVESTSSGVPVGLLGSTKFIHGDSVYYSNWTTNSMNLKAYIGHKLIITFTAAGCYAGGHVGYAYVDAVCSPIMMLTHTPEVCLGGTITITAPNNTPTGSYAWQTMPGGTAGISGSTTGQSCNFTAPGTYQVTVTQAPGCFYTLDTTIAFYPLPSLTMAHTNATCVPGNNGTITATETGGNAPYTYSWSPGAPTGQGTTAVTGLGAGLYTCLVTTTNGCTFSATATITQPVGTPVATFTNTPASCSPGSDGTANATASGGTGPYTYTWTPAPGTGQGTSAVTGLNAGIYTLTMADANGCPGSSTVTITQPGGPTTTSANTPVSCNAGSDGTATVTGAGGTAPLTYSWTANPSVTSTITGVPAGTYTCTVQDSKGCSIVTTVIVTQPTPVTATNAPVNEVCFGGTTGSLTVTPGGGTGPYTFAWTAPATGTLATASNLPIGTYTCTVTDSKGCPITTTGTITQPVAMAFTTSNTGAVCGQSNGSATVTPTGGTAPYTYLWNPAPGGGQGTATATGIPAGNYTCTITDNAGCIIAPVVAVPNTGGPVLTMGAPVNVTCFGLCNGSLTATSVGGVAPITYAWSPAPGAGQGTLTASALCPGTYILSATDANGCVSSATGTITQPPAITVSATSTNDLCFGSADGTATGTAGGGSPALTYTWAPAPGAGQGTLNATALTANTYVLTVTDANGCTNTATTVVTQPALLTVLASGINATCNGLCNGQVICIPSGGTPSYTYAWNTGCAAASCSAICAGNYNVNITDAHGCTTSATATVTEPPPTVLTMFPKAAHCGLPDGKDSVFAAGGNGGFTYLWNPSGPPPVTTPGLHNIVPGSYTVIVKDAQGCLDSSTNIVPNLPGVTVAVVSTKNVTCFGGVDGNATVAGAGGTVPYTFAWSPAPATASGNSVTANNLSAGTYVCSITDSAGCQNNVTLTITQPPLLTLAAAPGGTICIGQCFTLSATGAGGSPAYTYSWTQNGTPITTNVCPLVTTTYTASCTDSHGCVSPPVNVTVIVNPPLEVVTALGKSICPGTTDTLNAIGTGGNGNYSYTWMPLTGIVSGSNTANPVVSPAVTTTYTVIVSDNCGTPTDSATATVTLYIPPIVNFTTADTQKCAPMCAYFIGVSTPPCASAIWTFGDGTSGTGCGSATHCYNIAGTYNISYSVIDIDGCPGSLNIPNYINVWPKPTASFIDAPQPTTIVNPDIYFTDTSPSSHADSIVGWQWVFGDFAGATSILQNPKYTYPDTGCFTAQLIVTNQFGCKDTTTRPICIAPEFTFYAPNTFTPNGDGKNDVWMPYGIGIDPKNYHLMIFDRWGNLLFETHTWDEGWDGRANGGANIAQIDTYVWKVVLMDVFHEKHQYLGHCNIIK